MLKFGRRLALRARAKARAQGYLEFGLIVAGVAILGMLGLTVLGQAERTYFTGVLPTTDSNFSVAHSATAPTVTLACSPLELRVAIDSTNCVLSAADINGGPAPVGTLMLQVPSAPTCSTTTVSGATVTCRLSYTPTALDAPSVLTQQPLDVRAEYIPAVSDSLHLHATSAASVRLTIDAGSVNLFAFCTAAQVAQPSYCTAQVNNTALPGNPAMPNVNVYWSTLDYDDPSPEPGIGCWMDVRAAIPPDCSPLASSRPLRQTSCVTDSTGFCEVIYRRGYDPPRLTARGYNPGYGGPATHSITVSTLMTGQTAPLTILPSSPHDDQLISFSCTAPGGGNSGPLVGVPPGPTGYLINAAAQTITVTTGGPTAAIDVDCTAVFKDIDQAGNSSESNAALNDEFAPACLPDPTHTEQCARFRTESGVQFWGDLTPNPGADSFRSAVLHQRIQLTGNPRDTYHLYAEYLGEPISNPGHESIGGAGYLVQFR